MRVSRGLLLAFLLLGCRSAADPDGGFPLERIAPDYSNVRGLNYFKGGFADRA